MAMDITGTLAKLLATENLTVVQDTGAETASFNTETRTLTLPVLENTTQEVMTMFAAHEVGHALQTPVDWVDRVIEGTPFDFVNVIEDVRIEKFIQNKFPGLKRDFSRGYTELNDKDFFHLAGEDINKMSLIDRINLHFKLGYRAVVNFTNEEMTWVRAIDDCDTFDKVCLTAKMLADWIDEQKEDEVEQETPDNQETTGAGDGDGESEEEDTEDNDDESNQTGGSKGVKGEDPKEEEENENGEQKETDEGLSNGAPSPVDQRVSQTQRAFTESTKNITGKARFGGKINTLEVTANVSHLVDIDTFRSSFRDVDPLERRPAAPLDSQFKTFLLSIKKDVNHMVQRFEMRKSADAYSRQQVNKTGVLNTGKLHQYKLTDDIFLRQTVTPDGKSHGLVIYLDWSGSMCNICFETIKQIVVLAQFCRKVQIPYVVYSFTSKNNHEVEVQPKGQVATGIVDLVEIATSSAKTRDQDTDLFHLFCQGYYQAKGYGAAGKISPLMSMAGTPLNNALLLLPNLIYQFRNRTGTQKVSFVAITDGQSSPIQYFDGKSGRAVYEYNYEATSLKCGNQIFSVETKDNRYETNEIVKVLKKLIPDTTFTNIFLGSRRHSDTHAILSGAKFDGKKFTKDGGFASPGEGWDLVSLLDPRVFGKVQEDIDIDEGAKKAQIKTALKKFLKAQSSCKTVLNSLADQFS